MTCPNCDTQGIPNDANYCPNCGNDFSLIIFEIDEKYGAIDRNGKIIIPFQYESVCSSCDSELYVVRDEEWNYGVYNSKGCLVLELFYDDIKISHDGYIVASQLISRGRYEDDLDSYTLYVFRRDSSRLYIEYPVISEFKEENNGLIPIRNMEGKWGLIRLDGTIVCPFEYDDFDICDDLYVGCKMDAGGGDENEYYLYKAEQVDCIDGCTQTIIKPLTREVYKDIIPASGCFFEDDEIFIALNYANEYFLMDKDGKKIPINRSRDKHNS